MRYWPLLLTAVGAAGLQGRIQRVDPQHFAQSDTQILGVAARLDMARADVVGVAAVARSQVQIAVRAERDRAAVVVARVLAERDDLAARRRIDHGWDPRRSFSTR